MMQETLELKQIGIIHSPFKQAAGTPIQHLLSMCKPVFEGNFVHLKDALLEICAGLGVLESASGADQI
jgi:tRNA (Thr-GGU) A37 N-methylase